MSLTVSGNNKTKMKIKKEYYNIMYDFIPVLGWLADSGAAGVVVVVVVVVVGVSLMTRGCVGLPLACVDDTVVCVFISL